MIYKKCNQSVLIRLTDKIFVSDTSSTTITWFAIFILVFFFGISSNLLISKPPNVSYSSDIIYPSVGSVYDSIIQTKNKVGIISYIQIHEDDTMENSPYIIITPKEYMSEEVFDTLKVNEKITIKVKSFRIKYMAKQIQIVAELV